MSRRRFPPGLLSSRTFVSARADLVRGSGRTVDPERRGRLTSSRRARTRAGPRNAGKSRSAIVRLEADVTDSSARHIAGRGAVVKQTASRYAGLNMAKGWVAVGERVPVELGLMDRFRGVGRRVSRLPRASNGSIGITGCSAGPAARAARNGRLDGTEVDRCAVTEHARAVHELRHEAR